MADRIKIAAVVTAYYPRSHADVIVTKFLKGFPTDEGFQEPRVDLVSMYLDQIAEKDIGVKLAEEHGIPIFPSIPSALTLGGKDLAVDGSTSRLQNVRLECDGNYLVDTRAEDETRRGYVHHSRMDLNVHASAAAVHGDELGGLDSIFELKATRRYPEFRVALSAPDDECRQKQ